MLMHPIKTSATKIFIGPICHFCDEFSAARVNASLGHPK